MHAAGRQYPARAVDHHDGPRAGLAGIKNGDVLNRAEEEFDVLVTADCNLPQQQKLSGRRIAVVVLPSNQGPVVVRLLPELERVLDTIQPGTLVEL